MSLTTSPRTSHLQERLARNLKARREHSGLGPDAFGALLGVNGDYIASLERGEVSLSLRAVDRLATHIGVDPLLLLAPDPPRMVTQGKHTSNSVGPTSPWLI